MVSTWDGFDQFIHDHEKSVQTDVGADVNLCVRSKTTFIAATVFKQMMPLLILSGRSKDALKYAELTHRFALLAIDRGDGLTGLGSKLTPAMCMYCMEYAIYLSRWCREGRESRDQLVTTMEHAEKAVEADTFKPRSRFKKTNAAMVGGLAAKLDKFDIASAYVAESDGLVNWEVCGRSTVEFAQLYRRVICYLAGRTRRREERSEIIEAYVDLLARTRSGTVPMLGLENGNLESMLNLAYFGLKHFEELRQGEPFTYEVVVRSIRFAPDGR